MATPDSEKLLLQAINILLETIGQNPIEDEIDFEVLQEAKNAKTVIEEVTLAVLGEEWDFNTDEDYVFPVAPDGTIPIPYNVLDLSSSDKTLTMRQWKIYSKQNQSFIFDEPQSVNVIWSFPFNELTHPLRHYITIRSARIYTARNIGDGASFQYTQVDEDSALYSARHSDTRTGGYNMLNSSFGRSVRR